MDDTRTPAPSPLPPPGPPRIGALPGLAARGPGRRPGSCSSSSRRWPSGARSARSARTGTRTSRAWPTTASPWPSARCTSGGTRRTWWASSRACARSSRRAGLRPSNPPSRTSELVETAGLESGRGRRRDGPRGPRSLDLGRLRRRQPGARRAGADDDRGTASRHRPLGRRGVRRADARDRGAPARGIGDTGGNRRAGRRRPPAPWATSSPRANATAHERLFVVIPEAGRILVVAPEWWGEAGAAFRLPASDRTTFASAALAGPRGAGEFSDGRGHRVLAASAPHPRDRLGHRRRGRSRRGAGRARAAQALDRGRGRGPVRRHPRARFRLEPRRAGPSLPADLRARRALPRPARADAGGGRRGRRRAASSTRTRPASRCSAYKKPLIGVPVTIFFAPGSREQVEEIVEHRSAGRPTPELYEAGACAATARRSRSSCASRPSSSRARRLPRRSCATSRAASAWRPRSANPRSATACSSSATSPASTARRRRAACSSATAPTPRCWASRRRPRRWHSPAPRTTPTARRAKSSSSGCAAKAASSTTRTRCAARTAASSGSPRTSR